MLPKKTSWSTMNVACVTFNNETTVVALLESLLVEAAWISEVVLHDNGSSDSTVEAATQWSLSHPGIRVTIVQGQNVGFSAGVYAACQNFADKGLPTLCLNPDALLSPGTAGALLSTLNTDAKIGIVTAPLIMSNGEMDPSCVRVLPKLGSSIIYSMLGKLLPRRFRYNSTKLSELKASFTANDGFAYQPIEATTGALMLVSPVFRPSSRPIFDMSYWMYGEDLQICKDAADEGFSVVMVDCVPSVHLKGVSSGWPRSSKSNKAFHEALFLYFAKNFSRGPIDLIAGKAAVFARYAISQAAGEMERFRKGLVRS